MTFEEKRALFRFLALYLGSLFVLFTLIAYLFYVVEYSRESENSKHQMQIKANALSAQIIHAHMSEQYLSLEKLVKNPKLNIGFYDQNQKTLNTTIKKEIDFSKKFYKEGMHLILVDQSAFGHLDVTYTVIKEHSFYEKVTKIERKILTILGIVYLLFTLIGYFLAKLFIKPLQMKRIQLNNFIKESTHELNTPISALLMSIQSPSKIGEKEFERIEISAKRISDIYKDLTYLFLKNSENDIRIAKKMSINRVLKSQITNLKPLANKKKITIKEDYLDEIIFTIDEESLIRLINNLLSNAIKYNKIKGEIQISTKGQTLTIKDSGIGIPKEHQKEIYKQFYRATKESGGFGLGLNIVYKICKTYDIDIKMESKEKEGTTFYLKF